MGKPWIYVSGPYSEGDTGMNVRRAVLVGHTLRKAGACVIVPHSNHVNHLIDPQTYDFWLSWDLDLLAKCDLLVRLPGPSNGADVEVMEAKQLGIPVLKIRADLSLEEAKRIVLKLTDPEYLEVQ